MPPSGRLVLPWAERSRSRLRCRLDTGEEAGILLPPGTVLRDGDLLVADGGRAVEVVAAAETLMEARAGNAVLLARCAWHLGNRHVPIELGEGWVRFAPDHVLRGLLVGLGAEVSVVSAPFQPEPGAYAHVHGPAPKIHEYRGQ